MLYPVSVACQPPYGTHWAGGAGADIDDTWPTGQLAAEDENYAPFVSEDWTEVGRVEGTGILMVALT